MLKASGIHVERGGKKLLRDLNLELKDGEILAVIGTNGTGKSTLAYTLMGVYPVSAGEIVLDGDDLTEAPIWERARKGITLAWQEPARFEGITVRKYLELSSRNGNELTPGDALRKVALSPSLYLDRKMDDALSGGERKRIELASVMMMHPKVAILDEPDSGIDMTAFGTIIDAIKYLRSNGSSILLITHHPDILSISDRAVLMCRNTLIKSGSPDEMASYFEKECEPCDLHDFVLKKEVSN